MRTRYLRNLSITIVAVLMIFGLSGAKAVTVLTEACDAFVCATGINGVNLSGTLYNVTFEQGALSSFDGSDFPLLNNGGATSSVRNSIVTWLTNDSSATRVGSQADGYSEDFHVPASLLGTTALGTHSGGSVWASGGVASVDVNDTSLVYATFALAPVPVPAAVWLFGSALGLLGWLRRRPA